MDVVLDSFTFERLVCLPTLCEALALFHFKGKTVHKLLRNVMALSKALIGSQGKIKLQLLYGKSNGKERLLPEKRWALPEGVAAAREETLRLAVAAPLLVPLRRC